MSIEYYTTEPEEATGEEKAAALEKIDKGSVGRRLGNVARKLRRCRVETQGPAEKTPPAVNDDSGE